MSRGLWSVWMLGIALFAVPLASSSLMLRAQAGRTIQDGVYTEEQALRGQGIYKERCAMCHGEALGGDLARPLTGSGFIGAWSQRPLSDLVNKIQTTMPANQQPGYLTREQAADLVAHILQVGMFPAGRAELSADEAALKAIAWPDVTGAPKP